MKYITILPILVALLTSCHKNNQEQTESNKMQRTETCSMQKVYADNAAKVSITSGVWGTVAFMEGDCMPVVPPTSSTCKTCPVKRTVRIYAYTMRNQATPVNSNGFYDGFSTPLLKEVETDENGFFQTDIPNGHYTIVVVENGKLYTSGLDGQGGLNPVIFEGGRQNVNLTLRYKAVF